MKKPLEIIIRNKDVAAFEVLQNPHKWYVISLRDMEQTEAPVDRVLSLCKDILVLNFDDVHSKTQEGKVLPTIEDVKTAIEWARGKSPILVHCFAGIRRSSAIAYLIACDRVGPKKAISILNPLLHWPNPLMIALGAEFLGDSEVEFVYHEWTRKVLAKSQIKAF